ncbi:MAG: hypothetical protein ACKVTZ_01660 [Bacteroidia bacterium]
MTQTFQTNNWFLQRIVAIFALFGAASSISTRTNETEDAQKSATLAEMKSDLSEAVAEFKQYKKGQKELPKIGQLLKEIAETEQYGTSTAK